ncbi:MAG: hypothetical protein GY880_12495 [Planctomycetaceae bacterium]|nr:hypothetical protein [Planctomycetaceae bacterium]
MHTCILHIGMPKTGTTSIQATLFDSCPDDRFSLVTLDSFFGNRTIGEAFLQNPLEKNSVFFRGLTRGKIANRHSSARAYYDRALGKARRLKKTPIISAEIIWRFREEEVRSLVSFIAERGFRPVVYGYCRPPLDALSAILQQYVRVGHLNPWERLIGIPETLLYREKLVLFNNIVGRDSANFQIFDPASFRDHCVVRNFCDWTGIQLGTSKIRRVNESLNANAVKLLYAASMHLGEPLNSWEPVSRSLASIKWETLVRLVRQIPGPPLRLHQTLVKGILDRVEEERSFIEEHFGRYLPLSLTTEGTNEAIRTPHDLQFFDDASLEWLSTLSGQPKIESGRGPETAEAVGRQLMQLSAMRYPRTLQRVVSERFRLATKRTFARRTCLT